MTVPSNSAFNRAVLEISGQSIGPLARKEIYPMLAEKLNLTDEDQQETTKSGVPQLRSRGGWAISALKDAGLLEYVAGGKSQITERGRGFLASHTGPITSADLASEKSQTSVEPSLGEGSEGISTGDGSPAEQIANLAELHDRDLAEQILGYMKGIEDTAFERLVVDLLTKMGYGEGRAIGHSGDGGIDGILTRDPLGLDKVYLQAKKWDDATVGSPKVTEFCGSLVTHGATTGVLITTSTFSQPARQTAGNIALSNQSIRLIDGQELADLMIRHSVGVITEEKYEIKKIDANYFAEV